METKDISQAFLYHLQWKSRLRDFVNGRGDFDIAEISPDGCSLGKLLSSDEMKQYGSNARREELVRTHNELHDMAKRVYDLKIMGQDIAALQELSNITHSSMEIHSLLTAMNIISESDRFVLQ